ncbi:Snf7 family [Trinorchestia longiramus]|nr:Snf7 family [Trinorchestia longiramus]
MAWNSKFAEIKKLAKTPGNQEALRILAKQLVVVRKQKTRSYTAQSKITGISGQQKAMGANYQLANSMQSATSTMQSMNKIMNPQAVAQNMRNFEKAAAQLNMTDEIGGTHLPPAVPPARHHPPHCLLAPCLPWEYLQI